MMRQYEDKSAEGSLYRTILMGMNVGVILLIVIVTAAVVPDISQFAMCALCLVLTLFAMIRLLAIDQTLIISGQFLVEDGDALYVVIGTFGLGFGKKHRQNRHITTYRYYYLESVDKISANTFGVRIKARVYTATNKQISVDKSVFQDPGAMREQLTEKGRRKTVIFRLEHNLKASEEQRLLKRLAEMQTG